MESLSNNELIKQIKRYQYNIQQVDPPENDTQRVLHYIRKLSKLPIKLEELEKTGVGKTINALRKRQGSIGEEATLLVAKWKSIAKRQVQEEESAAQQRKRSSDSHSDYESPGSDLKSSVSKESKKIRVEVQKQPEKLVKELKLKSSKHTSDRLSKESLVKKRKHSSDDEEKVAKKNKHIKLEPEPASEEENYSEPETKVKQVTPSKPVKSEDKHHDRERKKRKEKDKQESDKSHKKEQHDKKHHKSNKHKDDKSHHRHHSKSSHPEKTNRDVSKSDVDKHRNDKKSDSKNRRDSEKPTSSSKKDSKSNGKHYSSDEAVTSTRNDLDSDDSDTYHDFSVKTENTLADDDFGAALLSISQTTSPVKRKSTPSKYSSIHSSPATNSPPNSGSDFDTISSSVKLEPLDDIELELKEDSYSSNNDNSRERAAYRLKNISDDVAMNSMYTTKNQRTKVFSGFKSKFINAKFPTLFELCVRVLQDNFDALEYTGGVPYDVLKPILEKVTVEQLYAFENYNPYLIGETDELWECHVKRHFRSAKRLENETWRDVYLRCVEEREEKLQSLTENISQSIANSTPVRKTKLAYFDSIVKPPRNVARSQAKHGTGQVTGKRSPKGPQPSQAAVLSVKDRLARESMAAPVALSAPSKNLLTKKKKAPLMQKTLQLLKGMKR